MRRLLDRWRDYLRNRAAAAWVVRMDEDPVRHEAGLRRWIGNDQARGDAYNSAYRSFHGAAAAARRIYAREAIRSSSRRSGANASRRPRLVLVSSLSLVVAAAAVLLTLNRLDFLARNETPAGQVYETKVGEVRSVRLADGSMLVIDTATAVRIAFTSTAREVTLVRGRVRFDVARDAARPFIVSASGARITDRGTVFDVEDYGVVSVRLISGAVDINLPRATGGSKKRVVHLRPGQQFHFDPAKAGASPAPQPVPTSDLQWVSGMKTFDDVPVADIITEVNRYSTTKIVLADPTIGSRRVFLDLDIRDSSEVAENLAKYLGLKVDKSNESALVLRPQQMADRRKE